MERSPKGHLTDGEHGDRAGADTGLTWTCPLSRARWDPRPGKACELERPQKSIPIPPNHEMPPSSIGPDINEAMCSFGSRRNDSGAGAHKPTGTQGPFCYVDFPLRALKTTLVLVQTPISVNSKPMSEHSRASVFFTCKKHTCLPGEEWRLKDIRAICTEVLFKLADVQVGGVLRMLCFYFPNYSDYFLIKT